MKALVFPSQLMKKPAARQLFLTYGRDTNTPIQVGQCVMDLFNQHAHHEHRVTLNYKREEGLLNISEQSINEVGWTSYKDLYFEHSDTCPSRRNRLIAEDKGEPTQLSKNRIKIAVCSYIMDNQQNLLITRRPSTLRIFPQAWVLPGGIVDIGECIEHACLREVQEEIGLHLEQTDTISYKLLHHHDSGLHQAYYKDAPDSVTSDVKVDFSPYYLYESVTKNVLDIDDHHNEKFPPKSQHLVLFFMTKIHEHFKHIPLQFNSSEIQEALWISMDQLNDTFHSKHSQVDGYHITSDQKMYQHPNTKISTEALYPVYRYNPMRQGLGKGHFLALRYLLRQHGFKIPDYL